MSRSLQFIMKYTQTGYKPGRPRKGEIRPPSTNAIRCNEYRARRHERDPSFKEKLALDQAKWRAENLERSNEISRNTYLRKKQWESSNGELSVSGPFDVKYK